MKKMSFFLILSVVAVLFISSHLSAATRGVSVISKHGQSLYLYNDYQALVIGVSDYERWPKLPNAVNDAIEVAEKFKSMGIHVKLVLDPTYREMKTALSDMVYEMGREQNRAVLFYYAGHGETETMADGRKMGYIIPRDCPLLAKNPRGFANHAISMRDIESASLRIRSKHVLMLFDSCFSGALFALVRAVPHDITEKSTLPVRQYITAGREDEEVPDQSMFKRCLLIGLEGDADLTGDGYITGSELGMYLSDKVVNYTHRQQHPQYGKINNPDLDRGDFVFALKSRPKPIASTAAKPSPVPKVKQEPVDDLERALLKLKERQQEKDAVVVKFKGLLQDLEKYKRIETSDLDKNTKLAAWGAVKKKYPEWAQGVKTGDSDGLVKGAIAKDRDGSLRRVIDQQKKSTNPEQIASVPKKVPLKGSIVAKDGEIARDGRFIAYTNGTVLDTKTNLMWAGTDAGVDSLNHSDATSYCEGYRGGGHTDWRMPTIDELESLYNENLSNQHGYHITKLIDVGTDYIWADHNRWGGKAAFNFQFGSSAVDDFFDYVHRFSNTNSARALPVRAGN